MSSSSRPQTNNSRPSTNFSRPRTNKSHPFPVAQASLPSLPDFDAPVPKRVLNQTSRGERKVYTATRKTFADEARAKASIAGDERSPTTSDWKVEANARAWTSRSKLQRPLYMTDRLPSDENQWLKAMGVGGDATQSMYFPTNNTVASRSQTTGGNPASSLRSSTSRFPDLEQDFPASVGQGSYLKAGPGQTDVNPGVGPGVHDHLKALKFLKSRADFSALGKSSIFASSTKRRLVTSWTKNERSLDFSTLEKDRGKWIKRGSLFAKSKRFEPLRPESPLDLPKQEFAASGRRLSRRERRERRLAAIRNEQNRPNKLRKTQSKKMLKADAALELSNVQRLLELAEIEEEKEELAEQESGRQMEDDTAHQSSQSRVPLYGYNIDEVVPHDHVPYLKYLQKKMDCDGGFSCPKVFKHSKLKSVTSLQDDGFASFKTIKAAKQNQKNKRNVNDADRREKIQSENYVQRQRRARTSHKIRKPVTPAYYDSSWNLPVLPAERGFLELIRRDRYRAPLA
eukprot:g2018.t1